MLETWFLFAPRYQNFWLRALAYVGQMLVQLRYEQ